MPMLHNPKRENFCQLTLQGAKYGWSQADIYKRSGYRADGHTAEVNASRLLKNAEIQDRIRELAAPAIKETAITARTLVAELEAARAGATTSEQFGAATAAIIAKAKLLGLDREGGNGGGSQFDGCTSVEQVIAHWLTEFASPAEALAELDAWRSMVEDYAASHATLVPAAEPARPAPGGEAERSLRYLQPRRRRR